MLASNSSVTCSRALGPSLTYTAFNVPITVTAPPKDQVADGSGLPGGNRQNIPG